MVVAVVSVLNSEEKLKSKLSESINVKAEDL